MRRTTGSELPHDDQTPKPGAIARTDLIIELLDL